MTKLKKLFGEINMTWPKVIIFAVITGVYTGLINQVPFLSDTSFTDIAVNLECWLIFAIIIISNCHKWWEAMLKTFVFFLISQPIVYLVEVPFLGFEVFKYYRYWFIITLLTIPGSFIAYWITKKNILSSIILSVATGGLVYFGVFYLNIVIYDFPRHIISAVFCFAWAIILTLVILDKLSTRITTFAITFVMLLLSVFVTFINPPESTLFASLDENTNWTYEIENPDLVNIKIDDGYYITMTSNKVGSTKITFKGDNGETKVFEINIDGRNHLIHMDPIE